MKLDDLTTLSQLRDFLSGTQAVAFSVIGDKDTGYRWIQGELVRFRYLSCSPVLLSPGQGGSYPLPDEGQRLFPAADHAAGRPVPRYWAA